MIALACPEHPKYKAVHPPRSTIRHSAGCECCWWIYRSKRQMYVTIFLSTGSPVMKVCA